MHEITNNYKLNQGVQERHMPWYGMNHVQIVGSQNREAETIHFFTEIMGFDLKRVLALADGRTGYWFSDQTYCEVVYILVDETQLELQANPQAEVTQKVAERGGDPGGQTYVNGVHHVSWGVEEKEEIDQIADIFDEHDVPYWGPTNNFDISYSVYFEDPNEMTMQIYSPLHDLRGEWEQAGAGVERREILKEQDESDETVVRSGSEDGMAKQLSCDFFT